ncbi:radical SAM protein [Granulicella arctica]|uniref:radical SAM protein n=1 Tax=Granulicella arctica TaxID=940613 RepID=UPI0021DFA5FB|nr:radical SAM protein [Granulicella arctica]
MRAPSRLATLPILLLNIHTQCNCRCVMCDIWKRKDSTELSAASLERHRDSLRTLATRQVVLSGGESLLNRDLPDICAFFRSLNIRITLLTTGLLLHKRAALVAAAIDEIIISIDGPVEIHNAIRSIPRAFETIARGIQTVRTLNPAMPIACRTTVQKQNHAHLRATVEAAHALALDSISFLPADISSGAFNREQGWSPNRQSEIALDPSELATLESEVEFLIATHADDLRTRFIAESPAKLRRIPTRFREFLEGTPPRAPRCNAPWVSTVMEVDGTLRPCFFHPPVATTSHSTLEEAINSQTAQAFRSRLEVATDPTCQRCVCSLNLPV